MSKIEVSIFYCIKDYLALYNNAESYIHMYIILFILGTESTFIFVNVRIMYINAKLNGSCVSNCIIFSPISTSRSNADGEWTCL